MEQNAFLLYLAVLVVAQPVIGVHLGSSSNSNRPFTSKKSPSETINEYEVVDPVVSYADGLSSNEGHHKRINIVVNTAKDSYHLKLSLNELLLAPSFASGYHVDGGKVEESHPNCFYHGTVEGHDEWSAAFSTCYGLRGWFGDLNNPSNLYHIEPIEDTTSLTDPHALYMDSQHQNSNNRPRTCGTSGKQLEVDDLLENHHSIKKREAGVAPQTKIVEWLLVNDNYQYVNYGSNITAVTHRAIELANHVDLLYDQLNISIVLVYSLTWTEGQNITFSNDANTLLNLFKEYHRTNDYLKDIVHDSTMLITGINIMGPVVGLAFVNTMCQYNDGVAFTQDTLGSATYDGTTAAHELGHIFNMQHDDNSTCMCPDPVEGCIMYAAIKNPTKFSQCSLDELAVAISQGKDSCLGNHPTTLVGGPVCGNGIREPGEVCDCGSPELCDDPCCSAATCTLTDGSDCGEGECCENCQFKSYGTFCRSSSGECEITEYCTGDSSECPRDVNLQDGTPCASDTGYCFDGLCPSKDGQCVQYYGSSAMSGLQRCYDVQNMLGSDKGHCGVVNSAFVACTADNVNCGSLQCRSDEKTPIISNIDLLTGITYGTAVLGLFQGHFPICLWLTTAATVDEVSPGLIFDGTKCGDGKLCLSQQCVSIASLTETPCPVGSNGEVCSGNGVCNNLDKCSCNIGYTGTDCSEVKSTGDENDIVTTYETLQRVATSTGTIQSSSSMQTSLTTSIKSSSSSTTPTDSSSLSAIRIESISSSTTLTDSSTSSTTPTESNSSSTTPTDSSTSSATHTDSSTSSATPTESSSSSATPSIEISSSSSSATPIESSSSSAIRIENSSSLTTPTHSSTSSATPTESSSPIDSSSSSAIRIESSSSSTTPTDSSTLSATPTDSSTSSATPTESSSSSATPSIEISNSSSSATPIESSSSSAIRIESSSSSTTLIESSSSSTTPTDSSASSATPIESSSSSTTPTDISSSSTTPTDSSSSSIKSIPNYLSSSAIEETVELLTTPTLHVRSSVTPTTTVHSLKITVYNSLLDLGPSVASTNRVLGAIIGGSVGGFILIVMLAVIGIAVVATVILFVKRKQNNIQSQEKTLSLEELAINDSMVTPDGE